MNRRQRRGHVSQDRWLVSYADFMTLLFGLFVVLFAFAKADQKKQVEVNESVDEAFRSLGLFSSVQRKPQSANTASNATEKSAVPMNIVMGEDVMSPAQVKDDLEHVRRELTQTLSNQVIAHTVSIKMGQDGLVISLREAGFFASGSAAPKSQTLPTLRQIATSLGRTPYDLRIEGHTDNIPIHNGEFDSNWELSAARATRIARIFVGLNTIPAEHISAAGYAEFHPVASNDTADGRAENRRVDLVVRPRTKVDLSTPAASPARTGVWRKITDE
jgi:chemotaxis protein MotB